MGSGLSSEKRNSVEARHCVPLGLYPKCLWDLRSLRKLIMDKRIAPIFKGVDDPPSDVVMDECPICMLYYPGGLNVARCCKKDICTECFLQIRLPGNGPRPTCPYCQREGFEVSFSGPKSAAARAKEAEEERKVTELQEKMRQEEIERDRKREEERRQRQAQAGEQTAPGAVDGCTDEGAANAKAKAGAEAARVQSVTSPGHDREHRRGTEFHTGDDGDEDDGISVELRPATSACDSATAADHTTGSMDIPLGGAHSPYDSFAYSPDFVSEMSAASPAEMEEFMLRQAIALSLGQQPEPLPNSFS